LTQHPCAPLQNRQRAQTPHHPEQKNAHERDVREVSANAHEQNNPQVYNDHFFANSPFLPGNKWQQFRPSRNPKLLPPKNPFLPSTSPFFFAKVAFFFGNKGF
jgi:hypothetical protein